MHMALRHHLCALVRALNRAERRDSRTIEKAGAAAFVRTPSLLPRLSFDTRNTSGSGIPGFATAW